MAPGPLKIVTHGSSSAQILAVPAGASSVTVASMAANTERVWVSANPMVCQFPWYGTPVSPGKSVTVITTPGSGIYSYSPSSPAQLMVTLT